MNRKEFGNRLKTIRIQKGLSQSELAKRMGYKDHSTIAKVETGKNDITIETLFKYAKALNLDAQEVLFGDPNISFAIYTIDEIKERIKPVMKKHRIDEVYLFGSYSRGEATDHSDVDLYCSHGDVRSLLDLSGFQEELENALNKKVDIVTIGSQMHPYFKEQLDKDKIRII
jgi:predicted nucleotidyltransferase/DNA-binding Xre family transcriptional regulator